MEATPCTTSMPHPPPLEPSSATQARHCRAPTAPMFCCCRQHPPRATIHCTQNIHSLYSCFFGEPKKLASGGTEAYMCKCLGQHDRALRIGAAEVWPMLCRCRQQQDRPHRHALHLLTLPLQDRPHAMAPHRLCCLCSSSCASRMMRLRAAWVWRPVRCAIEKSVFTRNST